MERAAISSEQTVLDQHIHETYGNFLSVCEEHNRTLSSFVRREFEKYLE